MPLPKNYYTALEALDLIAKMLPDEDPKSNLLEALRDGQITAWYVDEGSGKIVDLSSGWIANRVDRGHSHLVFDARTGYARLSRSNDLTSLSRQRGGALLINKASLDALRSETPSGVPIAADHDTCEDWIRGYATEYEAKKAAGEVPSQPKRDTLKIEAQNKFPGLSGRQFVGAWGRAAHEDWKKGGRRPTSSQH